MAQIFFEDGQGDDAQKKGQEFVGRWNFHTLPSAPAYASDLRRGQEGMRLHVRGARERERGAGDDPSGDGSRRRGGASVVGLKSSSMGLVEAAAARGSRVILHFCCVVRDYGVFLRR